MSSLEKLNFENKLEEKIYKSCLKQVVEFLNTTLPPLENSSESEKAVKVVKEKKTKIKKIDNNNEIEDKNSYKIRDVTPQRVFKKEDKSKQPRKRVNKFSERKYNDMKELKKTRKPKSKKQ